MKKSDLATIEKDFFKRGNPLRKLLAVSLNLLDAHQTGILYGTNETRIKFLPTTMWDRGIMDRFDGRGVRGLVLKLVGTRIVTYRGLSPVYFYKTGDQGEREDNDGIISYVLRNCADYYRNGISVIICPDTDYYRELDRGGYMPISFYIYDGKQIRKPDREIKVDTRIVRQFRSRNSIYIYLPNYGILVINTADVTLLEQADGRFVRESELTRRLDALIKLVETASLAYLGQLKGRKGAELLWRKEEHLRQTSQDLIANEKRFRDLYENAPIAYFSMAPDGVIFRCNRQAVRLSGFAKDELTGKNITALLADQQAAEGTLAAIWKELKNGNAIKDMELQMVSKTKTPIWVSLSIDAVKTGPDLITELRAMAVDISKRKNLEKQLSQAQKMEAIGTLARGIAHDFNNVLSPVSGYAQMLLMDENVENREHIRTILDCSRHAKELVNQILTFSRQKEHEFILVKAASLVEDALVLVRSFLPATIKVTTFLEKDSGYVMADPVQIRQVIMNLATNAFHAMEPGGGALEISLYRTLVKPYALETDGIKPGPYVCLDVADTGHGIDATVMDHIFDPYFSTKQEGKGSGIGLSVVHGIIDSHGGTIRVKNRKERGTRFSIYLPVCRNKADVWDNDRPDLTVIHGTGNVILVDDDEKVALMHTRMLEKLGYTVACFTESPAALAAFAKNPDAHDILLTDLTMPDMTGLELARDVTGIRPEFPVVLCTGLGDTMGRQGDCPKGVRGILSKPVEIKALSFVLKQLLDPMAN